MVCHGRYFVVKILLKNFVFFVFLFSQFTEETQIIIRGFGGCGLTRLQEFARVIILDDPSELSPKLSDHEPFKDRPDYETLDRIEKIVYTFSAIHITKSLNFDFNCISDIK